MRFEVRGLRYVPKLNMFLLNFGSSKVIAEYFVEQASSLFII